MRVTDYVRRMLTLAHWDRDAMRSAFHYAELGSIRGLSDLEAHLKVASWLLTSERNADLLWLKRTDSDLPELVTYRNAVEG